jgi:hypothetical protein
MFRPCTRMRDLMRTWNDGVFREDLDFEEVELRAGAGNGAVDFFHHHDGLQVFLVPLRV